MFRSCGTWFQCWQKLQKICFQPEIHHLCEWDLKEDTLTECTLYSCQVHILVGASELCFCAWSRDSLEKRRFNEESFPVSESLSSATIAPLRRPTADPESDWFLILSKQVESFLTSHISSEHSDMLYDNMFFRWIKLSVSQQQHRFLFCLSLNHQSVSSKVIYNNWTET